MKRFLYFIAIFLWAMGTIGGVGYALYDHAYPIALGVLVSGVMAWPTVRNITKEMME